MEDDPVLLGSVPGDFGFEKHIHEILKNFRIKGEWFGDCRKVRGVMERVLAGDDFGYRPTPKPPPPLPAVQTPQQWLVMFNALVVMVYPGDPVVGLADHLEISPDDVRCYLKGEKPVPTIVASAFASRLIAWIMASQ